MVKVLYGNPIGFNQDTQPPTSQNQNERARTTLSVSSLSQAPQTRSSQSYYAENSVWRTDSQEFGTSSSVIVPAFLRSLDTVDEETCQLQLRGLGFGVKVCAAQIRLHLLGESPEYAFRKGYGGDGAA